MINYTLHKSKHAQSKLILSEKRRNSGSILSDMLIEEGILPWNWKSQGYWEENCSESESPHPLCVLGRKVFLDSKIPLCVPCHKLRC